MKLEIGCILFPFSKMTEIYNDYIQKTSKLKDRTHVLDADAIEKNKCSSYHNEATYKPLLRVHLI